MSTYLRPHVSRLALQTATPRRALERHGLGYRMHIRPLGMGHPVGQGSPLRISGTCSPQNLRDEQ